MERTPSSEGRPGSVGRRQRRAAVRRRRTGSARAQGRYVGRAQRMRSVIGRLERQYAEDVDDEDATHQSEILNYSPPYFVTFRPEDALAPSTPPGNSRTRVRTSYYTQRRPTGCSKETLERLPTSTGKTIGKDVKCLVCILTITSRESVRLLPCLHKFHKRCIDKWLKKSTECPVCKIDVPKAIREQDLEVAQLMGAT
ncbi:hypothetical protein AAMO2058_000730600 [Amorphochlora amoebiformis]